MCVLDARGAQLIVDLAFLQEPRGSAVHVGGLHENVRQGRVLEAQLLQQGFDVHEDERKLLVAVDDCRDGRLII